MNNAYFEVYVEKVLAEVKELLTRKGEEYNKAADDRFSNFHLQAILQGRSREQALLGNVSKQITSLYDLIFKAELSSFSLYKEKTRDIIVYMLLLEAMLKERCE